MGSPRIHQRQQQRFSNLFLNGSNPSAPIMPLRHRSKFSPTPLKRPFFVHQKGCPRLLKFARGTFEGVADGPKCWLGWTSFDCSHHLCKQMSWRLSPRAVTTVPLRWPPNPAGQKRQWHTPISGLVGEMLHAMVSRSMLSLAEISGPLQALQPLQIGAGGKGPLIQVAILAGKSWISTMAPG